MKLNQPLIISLLLHICLYLVALLTPDQGLIKGPIQPIEVVYQNETKKRQIVIDPSQDKLIESLKKLESQADRLSRLTRRVKEESVASKTGPTQNLNSQAKTDLKNLSLTKKFEEMTREQDKKIKLTESENGDQPSISKPMPKNSNVVGQNATTGVATISEYIPEVRQGGFTSLNSDQFVHYTFYARINEQIRSRWIDNVRDFLNRTSQAEVNRLAAKTQSSQVEILLDREGHFVKALIHRKAENPGLDESVISAFRRAAPLLNPPSEMVEADGYIHLHYGFFVQFRPRYLASGSK